MIFTEKGNIKWQSIEVISKRLQQDIALRDS
jgi:hypothetical protein